MVTKAFNRREFVQGMAATALGAATVQGEPAFKFRYIVGSSMYGELPLAKILPRVRETGAEFIDLWPRKHGNQREQVAEMGEEAFVEQLAKHDVGLGCSTRYDLGPFGLQEEMQFVSRLGGDLLVCGGKGPKGLTGTELKAAVKFFCEELKPHAAAAAETGVRLGIENHSSNLINTPDSLKWLAEFRPAPTIGIALAPYHLESCGVDADGLGELIEVLGDRTVMFYAWQHGDGCHRPMPKERELMQMPGRGDLDFEPAVTALKKINYAGYTEIFMHPTPRGIPILPTAERVTDEIKRSRTYLEALR